MRDTEHLASTPSVKIHGFPFLPQLASGRYRDVEVDVHDFRRGSLTLRSIDVHLRHAYVPFTDVVGGSVSRVPVDEIDGTVVIGYADITSAARNGLTLSYAGHDTVRVIGSVTVGGAHLDAIGTGQVLYQGGQLRVVVDNVSVNGHSAPAAVAAVARPAFTFAVGLPTLPFRIELRTLRMTSSGVAITAVGHRITLRALS